MRLFTAITFDTDVNDKFDELIKKLRHIASRGNFVAKDNLHLTLVYIGETNDILSARGALDSVKFSPFTLHTTELGLFHRKDGDVLWFGFEKCRQLSEIQTALRKNLTEMGFNIEKRKYVPHLTLARRFVLAKNVDKNHLNSVAFNLSLTVSSINLMQSQRQNGCITYAKIHENNCKIT